MRLARVLALAVLLPASQLSIAQSACRPNPQPEAPQQGFGPDSYRPGWFTGQQSPNKPTPGLKCNASAPNARKCEGYLESAVDCTFLDVTVEIPAGAPVDGHTLVAVLHGWGGSKTAFGYISDPLLKQGHAILRYSARGFGESYGQVNLSDVHLELQDLRSMIGQVVDNPELALNPDRVGITGISYGGGQTWLSLMHPLFQSPAGKAVRIRSVVPIVPWTDLLYSLMPNGRPEDSTQPAGSPKLSFINGLYASGLRRPDEGPQPWYPNYPDYLIVWHAWLNTMEPNRFDPVYRRIVDGVAGYRSIWWRQDFWSSAATNMVPVFQIQGLTDDLFPLPEAKRMLDRLRPGGYPIASYFGDIGHPRASNKSGERDYVIGVDESNPGLIGKWFAYYLKDSGTAPELNIKAAITRPRDQPFDPGPANFITADSVEGLANQPPATWNFTDTAVLANPVTDPYRGFCWDPLLMELDPPSPLKSCLPPYAPAPAPAPFDTPYKVVVTGSLIIAGQPQVMLTATTTSPRVQLDIRLIDVAPDGVTKNLITRGTFILEQIGTAVVTIPTYGNVWEVMDGHTLQLEITNLDSPYISPSRVPSVTQISQVSLTVPVYKRP
jgi:ABC-2 type transport system ATP-binding protein